MKKLFMKKAITCLFTSVTLLWLLSCQKEAVPKGSLSDLHSSAKTIVSGLENGGIYELEVQCAPGKVLNVRNAGSANFSTLIIWSNAVSYTHAQWKAIDVGNGAFELEPLHAPGQRLDVEGAGNADGTRVILYQTNGNNAQRWKALPVGNNWFELEPVCSPGKRLDVYGAANADGATVHLWTDNNTTAQRWRLIKINDQATNGSIPNTVELIASDSDPNQPHEGIPSGVPANDPAYWWREHPTFHDGKNSEQLNLGPNGFNTINPWGEVYKIEGVGDNVAPNTRVQIKDIDLYYLSKADNRWHRLSNDNLSRKPSGGPYEENFSVPNKPTGYGYDISKCTFKNEPDGTVSVTAGGGYNAHFWFNGDYRWGYYESDGYNPYDVKGLFATIKARLILNDPNGPDDRAQAVNKYILSVGVDMFKRDCNNATCFCCNETLGQGKFRKLRNEWTSISFSDIPLEQLRQNPPPLAN